MTTQIKIIQPEAKDLLFRERLFRRLDGARDKALTWVAGPAGSGKTALVSSYVFSRRLSPLWYRVDAGDEDPALFFNCLGMAAKKASQSPSGPLPPFSAASHRHIAVFGCQFFAALSRWLPKPAILVFDNLHTVSEEAPLHQALIAGLNHLPASLAVILMSRGRPPAAYSRLLANQQLECIGWSDLRLTCEEAGAIVRNCGEGNVSKQQAAELHRLTQGWAAGLQLLLAGRKRGGSGKDLSSEEIPESIFEYFAVEVFSGLDRRIRDFLLRVAYLPWMTVRVAAAATGSRRTALDLRYLVRQNLFVEKVTAASAIYRFHPLFQKFLQRQAAEVFGHEALWAQVLKSAEVLWAAGHAEDGADLLARAADRQQGYFHPGWWNSEAAAGLFQTALKADQETDSLRSFIQKYPFILKNPAVTMENWPWPVKIYTFGRFELVLGGKVFRPRKAPKKALALLKALIASGGRKVPEMRLAGTLWPDRDGDIQYQSLKTTIHRLRTLLADKEAIEHRDKMLTLNPSHCWVDVWAYERLMNRAFEKAAGEGEAEEIPVLEKACGFYQGEFLKGEEGAVVLAAKGRLLRKFIRGLSRLGRLLEEQSRWAEAIVWYEKALSHVPLEEEFYHRLMICYLQQGQRIAALAVYRRCQEILAAELGISPSPATVSLSKEVQGG